MTRSTRSGAFRPALALVALLFVLAGAACGSSSATPSPAASSGPLVLTNTKWLLISYISPDGTSYTVPSAVTPNLEFSDTTASGKGGCNTFTAPYTFDGTNLTMGPLAGTKAFCEDPVGAVENAYFAALDVVNKAAMLDTGRLQLWDDGGKTTLVFVPAT